MNLSHLRYFVKLAQEKHYTKAAELLCITQPSLSHAISSLEKELGVQLFEKNKRNTELTICGKQFLSIVENSLTILDNGVDMMSHIAKGEGLIRLGCLRYLGIQYIPNLVRSYQKARPGKDISFTFDVDLSPKLLEKLHDQEVDIVFASKPVTDTSFTCIPVETQDLVLIVPKDHPLASACTIHLQDTAPYPYILFNKHSGLRQIVNDMFQQCRLKPKIAYEISEDEVIAGMVAQGFGIAIVPYMQLLLQLDIKILPIASPQYERKFYMITNSQTYLPPVMEDFRHFVMHSSSIRN